MQLRQDDLTWHVLGDDLVVLDLRRSDYLKLNGSARVLWEQLTEPRTADELEEALVGEFEIDREVAHADVARFVADLDQRGLLS